MELIPLLIFRILSSFQTLNPILPIIKNLIDFKNVIINKIIRMQKTYLLSSRTDDYQHLWMHQHLHFTIYSIKRRKKNVKIAKYPAEGFFYQVFVVVVSSTRSFTMWGNIFWIIIPLFLCFQQLIHYSIFIQLFNILTFLHLTNFLCFCFVQQNESAILRDQIKLFESILVQKRHSFLIII